MMKQWIFCFCIIVCLLKAEELNMQKSIEIKNMKNPFYDEDIKTQSRFKLQALINEKAKINDKWYKTNEILEGNYLLEIHKDFVLLENEQEYLYLKIKRGSHKILID